MSSVENDTVPTGTAPKSMSEVVNPQSEAFTGVTFNAVDMSAISSSSMESNRPITVPPNIPSNLIEPIAIISRVIITVSVAPML